MRRRERQPEEEAKGTARFEFLRFLGKGTAGRVHLIQHKVSKVKSALKIIDMEHLTEREKKLAMSEVEFLRVIHGPTIIKFHESFIEKKNIHIVMDFAEGGSLSQMIEKLRISQRLLTTDQILMFTAQITLSLLVLHSKSIIHRDLKTQNIFLKEGVLKLGDFGISKSLEDIDAFAMTQCGTLYYLAPEVCKGESYNNKADIWALGVIIYELITLRKPFDTREGVQSTDGAFQTLFDMITNKPLEQLPPGTDSDLQVLIRAVLNKDKDQRPNIFQLANLGFIKSKIHEFIEIHDCKDEVLPYLDMDQHMGRGRRNRASSALNEA